MKNFIALLITFSFIATLTSFRLDKGKSSGTEFFQGSYDNMIREAKKQKKAIILDFWAGWCSPCQKLDKETFADKDLAAYLNQNFIVYKVDIDTFDGMEIVDRFSVDVFPTMIVFDPKEGVLSKYKGFYPPAYLQKELEKVQSKFNYFPPGKQELASRK